MNYKRLTENKIRDIYPLKDRTQTKIGLFIDSAGVSTYFEAINRLGEIEDVLGDNYDLNRLKELIEADKEGRCIILSEIKDGDSLPETEVIATNNIKYSYGYGSYLIGYIVKDETSETGYSCENDFSILMNVTHWGKLPKITNEGEE